jgi:hypothetical protein
MKSHNPLNFSQNAASFLRSLVFNPEDSITYSSETSADFQRTKMALCPTRQNSS